MEGALDGTAERVRGSLFLQELEQSSVTDANWEKTYRLTKWWKFW